MQHHIRSSFNIQGNKIYIKSKAIVANLEEGAKKDARQSKIKPKGNEEKINYKQFSHGWGYRTLDITKELSKKFRHNQLYDI